MKRANLVLCALFCACGPTQSGHPPRVGVAQEAHHDAGVSPDMVATVPYDAAPVNDPHAPGLDCTERGGHRGCERKDGCVIEGPLCRAARNECELVPPTTADYGYPRITYLQGDPCEGTNAGCAIDLATALCEPFVRVEACPKTLKEAEALKVFCTHSGQAKLECRYPDHRGTTVSCSRPPRRLSGMAPPPGANDTPLLWRAQRDYADDGCPLTPRAHAARCKEPRSKKCGGNLYGLNIYQCIRGTWKVTGRIAPPPRAAPR